MSFFQGVFANYGAIIDFAIDHPSGCYFMGAHIAALAMVYAYMIYDGNRPHWFFILFGIVFWPIALPVGMFSWFIAKIWEALSELFNEPDYGVRIRVVTHRSTREVATDQMTRGAEIVQLKEFQKLMETLNRMEELRQAVQKEIEKGKTAGDTPVSKEIESP